MYTFYGNSFSMHSPIFLRTSTTKRARKNTAHGIPFSSNLRNTNCSAFGKSGR
jgi:hypothetical protein